MEESPRFDRDPAKPEDYREPEPGRFTRMFEKVFPSIVSGESKEGQAYQEETYFDKRHEIKDLAKSDFPSDEEDEILPEEEQPVSHIGEVIDQKKTQYSIPIEEAKPASPPLHSPIQHRPSAPKTDDNYLIVQAIKRGFIAALAILVLIAALYLLAK